MTAPEVRIIGVTGLPEIRPGNDLARMLVEAAETQGTPVQPADVLVVTQKVVSKAEGRLVKLSEVTPSDFAQSIADLYKKDARLVELVLRESKRIVRMDQGVIITETRDGFICANAGIDLSNVEEQDTAALLPEDSDRSAAGIRASVLDMTGAETAVIISDTFGRPWREGCTNVAVGVSGMLPLVDYRGQKDPAGLIMHASVLAVADELASAAEPVMGKLDRIPAAIIRGYRYPQGEGKSGALVRAPDQDLFR